MKPSKNFYDMAKGFEGLKLSAYYDPATGGLPITIGYGSTFKKDGTRFKITDKITLQEAEDLFEWDGQTKAIVVTGLFPKTILTQNQFDAVLDFAYNTGCGKFAGSTLYKLIKVIPNDPAIPAEFGKWVHAGGKVLTGLIHRRAEEVKLYLTK